jgi:protein gp37
MGDGTKIEWTDATWNPIVGCSVISPGCTNCYAMTMASRIEAMDAGLGRVSHYAGTTKKVNDRAVWTGRIGIAPDHILTLPLRWRRGRRIFVNSMSDLFHEDVPDTIIDHVFAVMALSPQHTFQVLTKRPDRMRRYMRSISKCGLHGRQMEIRTAVREISPVKMSIAEAEAVARISGARETGTWRPLPNVWLGVSVEDQRSADERIPALLDTPAAVRWVSAEPLLGSIDLAWALSRNSLDIAAGFLARGLFAPGLETLRPLQWGVAGGESGPGARPMHPDWARSLRDQCAAAGVPFMFKQWGEWGSSAYKASTGEMVFRQFTSHAHWVNKASTWVRGGICLDAAGRRCEIGADISRAEAEGKFPITIMHRVGKKVAGRTLDGVLHDAYPEACHG